MQVSCFCSCFIIYVTHAPPSPHHRHYHYIRSAFISIASPPRPNAPSPDIVLTKKKISNIAQYIVFVPPCSALHATVRRGALSNIPDILAFG